MPNCTDCDAYIQSGARCQMCRVEHQHGTLTDGGATVIEDDDGDYKLVQPADDGGEE